MLGHAIGEGGSRVRLKGLEVGRIHPPEAPASWHPSTGNAFRWIHHPRAPYPTLTSAPHPTTRPLLSTVWSLGDWKNWPVVNMTVRVLASEKYDLKMSRPRPSPAREVGSVGPGMRGDTPARTLCMGSIVSNIFPITYRYTMHRPTTNVQTRSKM